MNRVVKALIGAVFLGAVASACVPVAPPQPPPTVIIYGDSFLTQAQTYVADSLSGYGWNVIIRQYPGTAACDWLSTMTNDVDTIPNIKAVEFVFTGNMSTPCTQGRGTQLAVYTADLTTAIQMWAKSGVHIGLVSPPGPGPVTPDASPAPPGGPAGPHPLAALYSQLAGQFGDVYGDGGQLLHDDSVPELWPLDLPCQSFDVAAGACVAGLAQVRTSATNGHLCDVVPVGTDPCPVYSSGVVRWGSMVVSVMDTEMGVVPTAPGVSATITTTTTVPPSTSTSSPSTTSTSTTTTTDGLPPTTG